MKIVVTQEHISKGSRGSIEGCPVALAVRGFLEATGMIVAELTVNGWGVRVVKHWFVGDIRRHMIINIVLPHDVQRRIDLYDYHGEMEPFEFEIEVPA